MTRNQIPGKKNEDLAHLGAYKKGYISALNHLSQQESKEIENTQPHLLKKNKAAEKDITTPVLADSTIIICLSLLSCWL